MRDVVVNTGPLQYLHQLGLQASMICFFVANPSETVSCRWKSKPLMKTAF